MEELWDEVWRLLKHTSESILCMYRASGGGVEEVEGASTVRPGVLNLTLHTHNLFWM